MKEALGLAFPRRHALVVAAPWRLGSEGAPQGHVIQGEAFGEGQALPGVRVRQGAAIVLVSSAISMQATAMAYMLICDI